jgi:hypothetical protein
MSDCVGIPYSCEIKRSSRPGPPVLARWVEQAREASRKEGLPWLVVVAGHGDRRPIVCLDFAEFVSLRSRATGRSLINPEPLDEHALAGLKTKAPVLEGDELPAEEAVVLQLPLEGRE